MPSNAVLKSTCSLLTLVVILSIRALIPHGLSAHGARVEADAKTGPLTGKVKAGEAFSFVYDGKSSKDFLSRWNQSETVKSFADGRELRVTTYRDPTGIEISREVTTFSEAAAIECILHIRNTGNRDTPIIENILPLNLHFAAPGTGKIVLHYARGSMGTVEDYLPIDHDLVSGTHLNLAHYVLKGTDHVDGQLPFFNLQWAQGGLIGAVGWSGQWAVEVDGESGRRLTLRAGQQQYGV